MPQKFVQEVRIIAVTIQVPVGTNYTDQDVCNLLMVKSKETKTIKVKGHHVAEETPA